MGYLQALEPLLDAPHNILKYVVHQFAKVLPTNLDAKRSFIQNGGLQKIQAVRPEAGSKLQECIDEINNLYPQEIVQYYNPGYKEQLIKRLDDFNPTGA